MITYFFSLNEKEKFILIQNLSKEFLKASSIAILITNSSERRNAISVIKIMQTFFFIDRKIVKLIFKRILSDKKKNLFTKQHMKVYISCLKCKLYFLIVLVRVFFENQKKCFWDLWLVYVNINVAISLFYMNF